MGVKFSHYEARVGTHIVKGLHAISMRRLFQHVVAVFVAIPDPPARPSA